MSTVRATEAKGVIGTKMWLTENTCDDELLYNDVFHLFRRDRVSARAGGVPLAVSKSHNATST